MITKKEEMQVKILRDSAIGSRRRRNELQSPRAALKDREQSDSLKTSKQLEQLGIISNNSSITASHFSNLSSE
jgi:hypothetical protein